jgi:hypothetical protein
LWDGYEYALCQYGKAMQDEWLSRPKGKLHLSYTRDIEPYMDLLPDTGDPPWLGDTAFHGRMRLNLIRKASGLDHIPYIWRKAA